MNSLYGIYKTKKFAGGGGLSALTSMAGSGSGGMGGMGMGMLGPVVDALAPPNQYGRQSMGVNIAKNASTYGAMGAQLGGPWGAAAGAVVGAGIGIVQAEKQKKVESQAKAVENWQNRQQQLQKYQQMVTSDPSAVQGNQGANYFANGGSLATEYLNHAVKGGSLQKLSSDSVAVKGPSHEQGGVDLGDGNEVEGNETIKGDYVLSSRLGFAQIHKPIAKAIGKLEQKAPTAATMNSLKNLRKREDALMLLQEHTKQAYGIQ